MKGKNPQERTPFLDAMLDYYRSRPIPFDVPGHKMGRLVTDLSRRLTPLILETDANAPIGMDHLMNPHGVIKESEQLMAKLCHADHALFSINGTTGGILSMFLGILDNRDKVILPRNCHKSVISALIISGAVPLFVAPDIDDELSIANGVRVEDYVRMMDEHPEAKAVFVINPTYFGIVSDLRRIVEEAHRRNMIVMVDEAHGSNFYFSKKLPLSAMDCGADVSSVSFHKNSGSLTQSSILLVRGERINFAELRRAYSMLTSTSPNPLLIASLDAARKEMALRGEELIEKDLALAERARKGINAIPGLFCPGREALEKKDSDALYDFDPTKLIISVRGLGLYGYDVYKELRKQSNIQLELGEFYVVLALIGPGTTEEDVEALLGALRELSARHASDRVVHHRRKAVASFPKAIVPPREGYDAPSRIVPLKDAVGAISAETVMAYPPGIPLLIPGELVTLDVVRQIAFLEREQGQVLKDSDGRSLKVIDVKNWYLENELSPFF